MSDDEIDSRGIGRAISDDLAALNRALAAQSASNVRLLSQLDAKDQRINELRAELARVTAENERLREQVTADAFAARLIAPEAHGTPHCKSFHPGNPQKEPMGWIPLCGRRGDSSIKPNWDAVTCTDCLQTELVRVRTAIAERVDIEQLRTDISELDWSALNRDTAIGRVCMAAAALLPLGDPVAALSLRDARKAAPQLSPMQAAAWRDVIEPYLTGHENGEEWALIDNKSGDDLRYALQAAILHFVSSGDTPTDPQPPTPEGALGLNDNATAIIDELRDLWQRALEREGNLASAVADVMQKATQFGTTEDGDTFAYIVPKGAMHRLVGVAQSNGAHVPVSFRAVSGDGTDPDQQPPTCPAAPEMCSREHCARCEAEVARYAADVRGDGTDQPQRDARCEHDHRRALPHDYDAGNRCRCCGIRFGQIGGSGFCPGPGPVPVQPEGQQP